MAKRRYNEFSDEMILWRYMGLHRFEELIRSKSFYFATAKQMDDPYEGSIPIQDAIRRHQRTNSAASARVKTYNQPELLSLDCFEALSKWHKISCWHASGHESDAMWRLYQHKNPEGIAIQTTASRLLNVLSEYRIRPQYADEPMWFGNVQYVNYGKATIGFTKSIDRFFYKRECFRHEQEFRVVVSLESASEFCAETPDGGILVPFEQENFCDAIYLNPFCDFESLRAKVEALLASNGWRVPVKKSSIDAIPIF